MAQHIVGVEIPAALVPYLHTTQDGKTMVRRVKNS